MGRMKTYYDVSVRPTEFQEGQKVLLYDPRKKRSQHAKWKPTWRGPFLIQRQLNTSNFVLRKLAGRKSFVVHTDRMRALSDGDSVDRNEVNKSDAPKPSLLSPSVGRETDVNTTAVGQCPQSHEAAEAGDLHAGVCVTSSTSGCTVAPSSESACVDL